MVMGSGGWNAHGTAGRDFGLGSTDSGGVFGVGGCYRDFRLLMLGDAGLNVLYNQWVYFLFLI